MKVAYYYNAKHGTTIYLDKDFFAGNSKKKRGLCVLHWKKRNLNYWIKTIKPMFSGVFDDMKDLTPPQVHKIIAVIFKAKTVESGETYASFPSSWL